jgi:DNA-binding winged helix-turn-helix (wHTH) protein/tetratricopeptide (TPR) repeat protein
MSSSSVLAFGPFCFDPAKRLLLRNGTVVSITPKALDTLRILIENRDRVVSKEELIRQLWPDTAVEEASLSQQIFLLRKALSDDSSSPQYIATISRRGFRFTGEVVERGEPESGGLGQRAEPQALGQRGRQWTQSLAFRTAALLLAAAAGVAFYVRSRHAGGLTDRDQLADLANATGDPIFDGTLTQGLAMQLDQSPFLSIVSRERVRETLQYMSRSPDDRVSGNVAREVCQRLGVKAMLAGSIAPLGTHFVVGLEATACQSGETIAREQEELMSREDVLSGLGRAAARMRAKLGESLRSIQRFNVPLTQATTSSLDALKAFSAAEERRAQGLELEAIPLYERAITLDSDFSLAYARLNAIFGNVGEWSRSGVYADEAFARQGRASERERFYIATGYYIAGQHTNMDKYRETLELWASVYPRDWYPLFAIADAFNAMGQYTKAIGPARQALQLNPDGAIAYERAAETYEGLNKWAEAKAVLESAVAAGRDSVGVREHLFQIAFAQGDRAAAARHAALAVGKNDEESMLDTRADAAAFEGKLTESRDLRSSAVTILEREQFLESVAILLSDQAVIESLCGDRRRTLDWTARALQVARPGIALGNVAEALANIGEVQRSEDMRRGLGPPSGWLEPGVVSTEAMRQVQRGNASSALETLRRTLHVDLGRYAAFRPPYTRGLTYLALHDGAAAAAEFQKILDHRGIAPVSVLYPLAYLQQGRAWALAGEIPKARKAYESFLTIWRDADPDVPILLDAKREHGRLPRLLESQGK